MAVIYILYLFTLCLASGQDSMPDNMKKRLKTPIMYTRFNEVSIVHQTKFDFEDFWNELVNKKGEEGEKGSGIYSRTHVREEFVAHAWQKIKIDPLEPNTGHFSHPHYDHAKKVYCNKFIKDFILRDGRMSYTKDEVAKWFEPTPVLDESKLKQPQVPL